MLGASFPVSGNGLGVRLEHEYVPVMRKVYNVGFIYSLLGSRNYMNTGSGGGSPYGSPTGAYTASIRNSAIETYAGFALRAGKRIYISQKAAAGFLFTFQDATYRYVNRTTANKNSEIEVGYLLELAVGWKFGKPFKV